MPSEFLNSSAWRSGIFLIPLNRGGVRRWIKREKGRRGKGARTSFEGKRHLIIDREKTGDGGEVGRVTCVQRCLEPENLVAREEGVSTRRARRRRRLLFQRQGGGSGGGDCHRFQPPRVDVGSTHEKVDVVRLCVS